MAEQGEKNQSIFVSCFLFALGGMAVALLYNGLFNLIAGEALPQPFSICLGSVTTGLLVVVFGRRTSSPMPEELEQVAKKVKADYPTVCVEYRDSGDLEGYPKPLVLGRTVGISRAVKEEWTPEALAWSLRTDIAATQVSNGRTLATFWALETLFFVGAALGVRLHWPFSIWLTVLGLGLSLIVSGYQAYLFQLAADKRFTVTDQDRAAAREALSRPYFPQVDRPLFKRWMYLKSELRGRAKMLGIDLERGYSVPTTSSPQT